MKKTPFITVPAPLIRVPVFQIPSHIKPTIKEQPDNIPKFQWDACKNVPDLTLPEDRCMGSPLRLKVSEGEKPETFCQDPCLTEV